MKKLNTFVLIVILSIVSVTQTSCYGPFKLTTKLHQWNGKLGDKFINALVFVGLNIVPVYSVSIFLDAVIFNSIEFWSGENPIDMTKDESETKTVTSANGTEYRIIASQNRFDVEQLSGSKAGNKVAFVFNKNKRLWTLVDRSKAYKLASLSQDLNTLTAYSASGVSTNYDFSHLNFASTDN